MRREIIAQQLEDALQSSLKAPELRLLALDGHRPEVDLRREPWIEIKYGRLDSNDWFGVVPATATLDRHQGQGHEALHLIVKVNPRLGLARNLIPWIIDTKGIRLDRPYWEYRSAREVDDTTDREFHVYATAEKGSAALSSVLPRFYGTAVDRASGERALFMEQIDHASRLDASGQEAEWPLEAIESALHAMAAWQAEFWGSNCKLMQSIGPRTTTEDMLADEALWRGMLNDAHARFPGIITPSVRKRRNRLIDTIDAWHPVKDKQPVTLVHNDFNQRNVGFRPDVIVLDWELAQRNTCHRDLVELLTFVLPPSADRADVDRLVESHRARLNARGAGLETDLSTWMEAFRTELKLEAINRIGMQCIFEAAFPLAYFERINTNIERLLDLYD
jgi:hypothetical protein